MTARTASVTLPSPVILYGVDGNKKPIAATFPGRLCDLAIKAGRQLKLSILKVTRDDVAELAKRLPAGRINSTGKGLVPSVKQGLFDQVLKMAASVGGSTSGPAAASSSSSSTSNGSPKLPLNEAGKDGNSVGSKGLPTTWKDIKPNDLVLVQESLHDGWWEAIVVERDGDMLKVRWRDYTRWAPFLIHADAVALLNASPSFKT